MNSDNQKFYEDFPIGNLNTVYAPIVGLEKACELDVEPLKSIIAKSESIAEIGAGEGRVIQGLLERDHKQRIYGIEKSSKFVNYLQDKFSDYSNVTILERDVLNNYLPIADLGLFLWSGFLEFSENEQWRALKVLNRHYNTVAIDTPSLSTTSNITDKKGQDLTLQTDFGLISGRIPSKREMQDWTKHLDKELEIVNCKTDTQQERMLYIFSDKVF